MLNKVLLIGNVGNDPDIKVLPNGSRVANISLATSDIWKDKNGQRQSRTEWHRVVVYNESIIKIIEKYLHKGSKIYIEGSIRSRKYEDSNGISRTSVEIIIQGFSDTIKLLDKKETDSFNKKDNDKNNSGMDDDVHSNDDIDDEVPF